MSEDLKQKKRKKEKKTKSGADLKLNQPELRTSNSGSSSYERAELRRTITSAVFSTEKIPSASPTTPISPSVSAEEHDYCPDVDSVLKWFKEYREMFILAGN